jgi:hypothetical protein
MANNKVYQILSALKTQLETISTANGYNHDIADVHIGLRTLDKIAARPSIDISAQGTTHEYFEGSSNVVSELTVMVRGYVDPDPDTATQDQWNLVEDICDAISTNITLGLSFQYDMKYIETATDAQYEQLSQYPRLVAVLIKIYYEHLDTSF